MVITLASEEEEARVAFGAWLREERDKRRLSRAEVGRSADLSDMQLYRIEAGESGSKRETLRAIAKAIGLDESEVLERAGFSSRSITPRTGSLTIGEEPAERLDPDFPDDDPILLSIEAFYKGAPPELRPKMLGEVARIVRDHQREQTTFGKKAETDGE